MRPLEKAGVGRTTTGAVAITFHLIPVVSVRSGDGLSQGFPVIDFPFRYRASCRVAATRIALRP